MARTPKYVPKRSPKYLLKHAVAMAGVWIVVATTAVQPAQTAEWRPWCGDPGSSTGQGVNGGVKMYRRGGVKMYCGLGGSLSP